MYKGALQLLVGGISVGEQVRFELGVWRSLLSQPVWWQVEDYSSIWDWRPRKHNRWSMSMCCILCTSANLTIPVAKVDVDGRYAAARVSVILESHINAWSCRISPSVLWSPGGSFTARKPVKIIPDRLTHRRLHVWWLNWVPKGKKAHGNHWLWQGPCIGTQEVNRCWLQAWGIGSNRQKNRANCWHVVLQWPYTLMYRICQWLRSRDCWHSHP